MKNVEPFTSQPQNHKRITANPSLKDINDLRSPFILTDLPFSVQSLEPTIDAETVEIHHDKHHRAYVEKLNDVIDGQEITLLDILRSTSKMPEAARNNGGGHWNHAFFWSILSGNPADTAPSTAFAAELEKTFGSLNEMKQQFQKCGTERFGSGWVWLIRDKQDTLKIVSTPNQDNPLMDLAEVPGWPLLAADLWEHAYYLKYHNKRDEFLEHFWSIVNWRAVEAYDRERKSLL